MIVVVVVVVVVVVARDANGNTDAIALVVGEAVFVDDALDEFGDGEGAEEDGPVVDFGLGGADVEVEGCWKGAVVSKVDLRGEEEAVVSQGWFGFFGFMRRWGVKMCWGG